MYTTLKIPTKWRDRLKEQAARNGVTMIEHLIHLVAAEDERHAGQIGAAAPQDATSQDTARQDTILRITTDPGPDALSTSATDVG